MTVQGMAAKASADLTTQSSDPEPRVPSSMASSMLSVRTMIGNLRISGAMVSGLSERPSVRRRSMMARSGGSSATAS